MVGEVGCSQAGSRKIMWLVSAHCMRNIHHHWILTDLHIVCTLSLYSFHMHSHIRIGTSILTPRMSTVTGTLTRERLWPPGHKELKQLATQRQGTIGPEHALLYDDLQPETIIMITIICISSLIKLNQRITLTFLTMIIMVRHAFWFCAYIQVMNNN